MHIFKITPPKVARWEEKKKTKKIIRALKYPSMQAQQRALKAVGNLKIAEAVPEIKTLLEERFNPYNKDEAMLALTGIDSQESAELIDKYYYSYKHLWKNDEFVKGLCGMRNSAILPVLVTIWSDDSNEETRSAIRQSLMRFDYPSLIDALEWGLGNTSRDQNIIQILDLLTQTGDRYVIPILLGYTANYRAEIRQMAREKLLQMGFEDRKDCLQDEGINCLEQANLDEVVRDFLSVMKKAGVDRNEYIDTALAISGRRSENDLVRSLALYVQKRKEWTGQDSQHVKILMKFLGHERIVFRRFAALSLIQLAQENFPSVQENWKQIHSLVTKSPHNDTNGHSDHSGTNSSDCHYDDDTHTDTGFDVQIPENIH